VSVRPGSNEPDAQLRAGLKRMQVYTFVFQAAPTSNTGRTDISITEETRVGRRGGVYAYGLL
jgi:hypothetical protein